LSKNYVNADAQCADVDIGGRKSALRARVNWQCWQRQFSTIFIKSNISAMGKLVVVKFHTNVANRWLFMIQRKIMAKILYS